MRSKCLRAGHRVTVVDPGAPGGEQASSYGNAGWLSSHSVIPPAEPGIWKRVPSYLADPLEPLAIRWRYLPRVLPWLVRYIWAARSGRQIADTARAMRTLLVDAPRLHAGLAEEASLGHLIERRGLLHVYPDRAAFAADAAAWAIPPCGRGAVARALGRRAAPARADSAPPLHLRGHGRGGGPLPRSGRLRRRACRPRACPRRHPRPHPRHRVPPRQGPARRR